MVKRLIVSLLLFFLIINVGCFVSAQPPFQQESGTTQGLTLRFPPQDVIKEGRDISAHIHVYNSSNELLLTNSSVDCFGHLYNSTGDHVLEREMEFADNGIDFQLNILGGNFSVGKYSFIIWCNSSTAGGFVSGPLEVTGTGYEFTTPIAIIYSTFFFILILLFIITIYGIRSLPSSNTKDEEEKIISINKLKYLRGVLWIFEWMLLIIILFISSNLGFAYLGEELFANILFTLFQICLALTPIIITLWIVWIFAKISEDKKLKKLFERGMFPQGNL